MSNVQLKLDQGEIAKLMRDANGPAWQATNRAGNTVKNKARQLAPVDQGGLRGSIALEMRNEDGPVAYVGSNLPYAIYVHEGTGIHAKKNPRPIVPVRAKALRWASKNNSGSGRRRYSGGRTAGYTFSKSSKGSPGRPFLLNALRQVLGSNVR